MLSEKQILRAQYLQLRGEVNLLRGREAAEKLCRYIQQISSGSTLSYASFGSELSTTALNRWLASKDYLLLPRVEGNALSIYRVDSLDRLSTSSWGIEEPAYCERVDSSQVQLVIVPALAFDRRNHRLGYGKGFYDRFLSKSLLDSVGVGFFEQLHREDLPTDPFDSRLSRVALF